MSNTQQSFQSGQAHAEGEKKMEHAMQSAGAAAESAQQQQQQAAGILQQTGEQVKQMAQGAATAVKNAVGMGGTGNH